MRRSMEQVYPLLRVAEHRLASQYYEMYRLFKLISTVRSASNVLVFMRCAVCRAYIVCGTCPLPHPCQLV